MLSVRDETCGDNDQLDERVARAVFAWDAPPTDDELATLERDYLADHAEAELAMLSEDDERRCEEAAHRYATTAARIAAGNVAAVEAVCALFDGPNRAA
jgi:hypothetical protein